MNVGRTFFLLVIISLLAACGDDIESNMSESMIDFEFTTQDEESLSLHDLEDEWWIANFMYTNCRTICPRTTTNLVDVQAELSDHDLHPQIVSFSVDPDYDTPDVLTDYAEEYGADLETWDFLTGYEFETIQDLSENTFHSLLEAGAADQRSHGYGFYLINPDGEIIKKYDGMSTEELDVLIEDVKNVL